MRRNGQGPSSPEACLLRLGRRANPQAPKRRLVPRRNSGPGAAAGGAAAAALQAAAAGPAADLRPPPRPARRAGDPARPPGPRDPGLAAPRTAPRPDRPLRPQPPPRGEPSAPSRWVGLGDGGTTGPRFALPVPPAPQPGGGRGVHSLRPGRDPWRSGWEGTLSTDQLWPWSSRPSRCTPASRLTAFVCDLAFFRQELPGRWKTASCLPAQPEAFWGKRLCLSVTLGAP